LAITRARPLARTTHFQNKGARGGSIGDEPRAFDEQRAELRVRVEYFGDDRPARRALSAPASEPPAAAQREQRAAAVHHRRQQRAVLGARRRRPPRVAAAAERAAAALLLDAAVAAVAVVVVVVARPEQRRVARLGRRCDRDCFVVQPSHPYTTRHRSIGAACGTRLGQVLEARRQRPRAAAHVLAHRAVDQRSEPCEEPERRQPRRRRDAAHCRLRGAFGGRRARRAAARGGARGGRAAERLVLSTKTPLLLRGFDSQPVCETSSLKTSLSTKTSGSRSRSHGHCALRATCRSGGGSRSRSMTNLRLM